MTEDMSDPGDSVDLAFDLGARHVAFSLDEELYPRDAIYGAAYLFLDKCYVLLSRPAERLVRVRLRSREQATEEQLEALAGEFANELLNQVLRVRIGQSTARIREQYLARAFYQQQGPDNTIAKLLAELDAEELDEEPLDIAVPWEEKHEAPDKPEAPAARGASDG